MGEEFGREVYIGLGEYDLEKRVVKYKTIQNSLISFSKQNLITFFLVELTRLNQIWIFFS